MFHNKIVENCARQITSDYEIESFMWLQLPDSSITLARFEGECRGNANFNITTANGENDYVTEIQVTNKK